MEEGDILQRRVVTHLSLDTPQPVECPNQVCSIKTDSIISLVTNSIVILPLV